MRAGVDVVAAGDTADAQALHVGVLAAEDGVHASRLGLEFQRLKVMGRQQEVFLRA